MVWVLAFVVLIAASGVVYQRIGAATDAHALPAPGVLVDIGGGRRLHVHCMGAGAPAVILDAGIAASSLSWAHVQPRVARFARVCSYDRVGLAWSDACRGPLTASRCAADLHALICAVSVDGPCVFVGHSYAAFVLSAYAAAHPERVAGLVLVDPIYPSEWMAMTRQSRFRLKGGIFLSRVGAVLAGVGVVRLCLNLLSSGSTSVPRGVSRMFGGEAKKVLDRLVGEVQKLPEEVWPAVRAHWSLPKCFNSMAQHLAGLRASAAEVAGLKIAPHIPVAVISAVSQTDEYRAEQARIASGSSRGRLIVAPGSGHWVHLDEPDLVVAAIRDLVDQHHAAP